MEKQAAHNRLDPGSNPGGPTIPGMAELVDAMDLKSIALNGRVGSNPTTGTI